MPTKKTIKKLADNIFERETGIRIYKMIGGSECHIVPHPRILYKKKKQYPVRVIAVALYHNLTPEVISTTRVTTSCGVTNCVHPDHLEMKSDIVTDEPTTEFNNKFKKRKLEKQKQKREETKDTPDHFGNIHDVPEDMWARMTDEEKQLARDGEFDSNKHGFGIMSRPLAS